MKLYLDNAATSYPKPSEVYNSVMNYMINIGANPGRGAASNVLIGDRTIYKCREALADFFNFKATENIIFTSNITMSLNILLKTTIKEGWHIITTSMEHNSVLRPLQRMKSLMNIEVDIINCGLNGVVNVNDIKDKIKSNTKIIVMSQSSNIIGSIQPLKEIGKLCRDNNIYFIIDSAQSAGCIPIDFLELNCNAIAFTAHKSLLGPQGVGGFIIDDVLNSEATSFIEGGTGSLSESITQPDFLPDKFESGTLNAPGIAGLLSGIEFINREGINSIKEKEEYLSQQFINGLLNIDSIKLYGDNDAGKRTSAISINSSKISNSEFSFILDNEFGIVTRSGLHCAPLAHKTIGTFPQGTIRFSFGYFNDIKDVNYTLSAINSIIRR
ncbi:aminotransferase class V-fold PLP-dependent enzyme [Clostridium sp.]|uniref:aminotransferase class V-fold PLP-dependent enzyme n=1 Tax=Clostridium sp. TaxID=1506 RepID=UPI002FDE80AB